MHKQASFLLPSSLHTQAVKCWAGQGTRLRNLCTSTRKRGSSLNMKYPVGYPHSRGIFYDKCQHCAQAVKCWAGELIKEEDEKTCVIVLRLPGKGGVVRTWFEIPCGIPRDILPEISTLCAWVYLQEWGWKIRTDTTCYCRIQIICIWLFMANIPSCFLGN